MAQSRFISEFTNGKELRVLGSSDEPLFVAKDVAEFLGYSNTKEAIISHVDEEDKITFKKVNPIIFISNQKDCFCKYSIS